MTEMALPHDDDFRGSSPAMSSKDLLLELWRDMKVVRPIAEQLRDANVIERLSAIETDHAIRDAQGGAPRSLVHRVENLEAINDVEAAAGSERRRIAGITNKTIATIVLVSNFVLGMVIMFVNLITAR